MYVTLTQTCITLIILTIMRTRIYPKMCNINSVKFMDVIKLVYIFVYVRGNKHIEDLVQTNCNLLIK